MTIGFLTLLVFLPVVLGVLLFFIPQTRKSLAPWITLAFSLLEFALSLGLLATWDLNVAGMQFVEQVSWIPAFGIEYHLGIDGISLWLMLLTTTLTPLVVLSSVKYIQNSRRLYYFLFLALETTMLGTFVALDLFLCCERSSWHSTTRPVGMWVMRMAESVLLTCWPPAPDER